MSSIELLCSAHQKKTQFICEKEQCKYRQLCQECLNDNHFKEHKYSIVNLREFLYEQNKSKIDLSNIIEKKLLDVKSNLNEYESFILKKNNEIDADFEYIHKSFVSITDAAKRYLKNNISKELLDITKSYEFQKSNFRKLKENILSSNKDDFLVNYEKEPVMECIEKLVNKNSDINEEYKNVRYLERNLKISYENKIVYNINENTKKIQEDLLKILNAYLLKFCRKFKLLLVRPSLEEELNKKTQIIRDKLYQELMPEKQQSHNLSMSSNLSQIIQTQQNNSSVFYQLKTDKEIIKNQILKIPEHIIILCQNFGDFQAPKKISHKKFIDLEKRSSVLLEDGSIYEGQWDLNNSRTGQGKCLFSDGLFYDGFWIEGVPHILGRFIKPDGDLLEGLVKRGKMNGKGVQVDLKGYKYVGFWKDNLKHGKGEENFPNGVIYKGEFLFDKHHGKGELILPNQSKYVGDFFEGKFDGEGEFFWANGESYKGEWSEDVKHGKGIYSYEDGRVYEGDFCDDVPHGFGKLIQKDGDIVESFWDMGKPVGMAMKQIGDMKDTKSIFFEEGNLEDHNLSLME